MFSNNSFLKVCLALFKYTQNKDKEKLAIPPNINRIFNVIIDNKDTAKVIETKINDNFFNLFINEIVEHNINTDPSNTQKTII